MKMKFIIPTISCQHCVDSITRAVSALPDIDNFQVDLESKTLVVDAQKDVGEQVITAVEDVGHEIVKN